MPRMEPAPLLGGSPKRPRVTGAGGRSCPVCSSKPGVPMSSAVAASRVRNCAGASPGSRLKISATVAVTLWRRPPYFGSNDRLLALWLLLFVLITLVRWPLDLRQA